MSLKFFHTVFITCSVVLTVFFGYWAIQQFQLTAQNGYVMTAAVSFGMTVLLIIYEINFIKKVKE